MCSPDFDQEMTAYKGNRPIANYMGRPDKGKGPADKRIVSNEVPLLYITRFRVYLTLQSNTPISLVLFFQGNGRA